MKCFSSKLALQIVHFPNSTPIVLQEMNGRSVIYLVGNPFERDIASPTCEQS